MNERDIAAEAMRLYPRSSRRRRAHAEQRCKEFGIDPMTILAIIQICIALWRWWKERDVTDPGDTPMVGEPPIV